MLPLANLHTHHSVRAKHLHAETQFDPHLDSFRETGHKRRVNAHFIPFAGNSLMLRPNLPHSTMPLSSLLPRIRALVMAQRAARMLLRALWLGVGGFLLGWGINALTGWLPAPGIWLGVGIVLALPALAASVRIVKIRPLAWALDRRLGLHEQVSAAVQAQQEPAPSPVAQQLIAETGPALAGAFRRVLRRGWFLWPDLEAAAIVGILLGLVLWARAFNAPLALPETEPLPLPPLAEETTREDVFPSNIPGLTGPAEDPDPQASGAAETGEGEFSLDDLSALEATLSQFGETLSAMPETFKAGEALQRGDLEAAAQAFEELAENADMLSDEARENLEQALRQAAENAEQAGEQGMAEEFEQAANALAEAMPNEFSVADSLDEVAENLRHLGQVFTEAPEDESQAAGEQDGQQAGQEGGGAGAGVGSGGQEFGEPEPFERFDEEGQAMELPGGEEPSGLLLPGQPSGESGASGAGATDQLQPADATVVDSILTPFHYSWRWRDVVSEYFTPR